MILAEREDTKVRPCLRCNKGFLTDRWHRICKRCHRKIQREHLGRTAIPVKVPLDNAFKSSVLNPPSDGGFYQSGQQND